MNNRVCKLIRFGLLQKLHTLKIKKNNNNNNNNQNYETSHINSFEKTKNLLFKKKKNSYYKKIKDYKHKYLYTSKKQLCANEP